MIKGFIDKLRHKPEPEPAPGVLSDLDKELGRQIQKREEQMRGQPITTKQPGPNMPRYQPCPNCHVSSKRESKTESGAYYRCRKSKIRFFVRSKEA